MLGEYNEQLERRVLIIKESLHCNMEVYEELGEKEPLHRDPEREYSWTTGEPEGQHGWVK